MLGDQMYELRDPEFYAPYYDEFSLNEYGEEYGGEGWLDDYWEEEDWDDWENEMEFWEEYWDE